MGVDTKGKLKGKVEFEQILQFVIDNFDKNATLFSKINKCGLKTEYSFIKESYDENIYYQVKVGHIDFKYKNRNTSIFLYYSNINNYENLEYHKRNGNEDMVKSETTFISLGCDDIAQEIIFKIVSHFGGWYDENDCDEFDYVYLDKGFHGVIKPIKRVTMKDIYERFGEIVIIDSK